MSALSELHRLKQITIGVPIDLLAGLARINGRRLGPYLSGGRQLPNPEIERLERTLSDLAKLVETAAPWPIAFKDLDVIRDLISRMHNGEFDHKKMEGAVQ